MPSNHIKYLTGKLKNHSYLSRISQVTGEHQILLRFGTWLNRNAAYDDYGHALNIGDGKGNMTYMYYGDNTHNISNSVSDFAHAHLSGIQKGSLTQEFDYYNDTGQIMTIKDSNGDSTIFEYDDFLKLKHQKNNNGVYLTGNDYYFSRKDNGDVYNPSDPEFYKVIIVFK